MGEELALLFRAILQIELGAEPDVATAFAAPLACCQELKSTTLKPWVLLYKGLLLLLQGHLAAADRCLDRDAIPRGEAQLMVCALSARAALCAMSGRLDEAESLFEKAHAEVAGVAPTRYRPVLPLFE